MPFLSANPMLRPYILPSRHHGEICYYCTDFVVSETAAQRGLVTCLMTHSLVVAPGFESRLACLQSLCS